MAEADKSTRQQKKRLLTRQINAMQRHMAEDNSAEDMKTKRNDIKRLFQEFELSHEQYQSHFENEADLDECDKYFQEAQDSYVNALKELNKYIDELEASGHLNESTSDEEDQTSTTNLGNLMNLPRLEIETFSGDPMKYHEFVAVFEQSVEKYCTDGGVRLTRLLQYTDGKAKKAIRACAIIGGEKGYIKARAILQQRFGDRHMITESITEKLRSGKAVYRKEDIQELADDLTSCVTTLQEMDRLHEIDTQRTMIDIVDRLPKYAKHRWQKKAVELKRDTGSYPDIVKLMSFMCDLADEVNDPVYGKQEDKPKKTPPSKEKKYSPRSFNAGTTVQKGDSYVQGQTSQSSKNTQFHSYDICPLCKETHRLFYCQQFKSMKPVDRRQFVLSKNLCQNCLLNNHCTKDCRKPGRCTVCNEKHTKFIHLDNMNVDSSVSSCLVSNDKLNCSGVSPNVQVNDDQGGNSVMPSDVQVSLDIKTNHNVSQILLPLVPVVVNGTYATHALLDNASTNSFCSEKLVNSLGLKGTGTTLNLSTIERSDVKRKMEVVSLNS